MAKNRYLVAGSRLAVTATDSTPSAPSTDPQGNVLGAPGAGVFLTDGASTVIADVVVPSTKSCTIALLAWNELAQKWFTASTSSSLTAGNNRFIVTNWSSKFGYVQVTVISAATSLDIYMGVTFEGTG